MKQFYPLLITSLLLSLNGLQAQEEFPVWETQIPGQIFASDFKEYTRGGNSESDVLRV